MTDHLFSPSDLRVALAQWPNSHQYLQGTGATDSLLDRVKQCLRDLLNSTGPATYIDLIALLRHWLLAQTRGGVPQWIEVPLITPWPTSQIWSDHGFDIAEVGNSAQVRPRYPRLDWLAEQSNLFQDSFVGVQARLPSGMPSDPVLRKLLGLPTYTGPGQREAIRALMHLPADTTLIANLPTGSGKSLLAQLPPLSAGQGSLTLVIVPTVALAIDQGRRMATLFAQCDAHWIDRPLAFYSGLSVEQRSTIFQAMRRGEQRILFTSPEAATGSLRSILVDCAREGRISHVVIDEAHLVVTWGSGFRPAFQLLPALIANLREARSAQLLLPIRVVLTSATLTPHTVTTLEKQFSGSMGHCVVSGIFLRPEPRYAMKYFVSASERKQRVLEAVLKAPRPFILYVTRPDETDYWISCLKESGLGRVAAFSGDTPTQQRESLMASWDNNALDGMVATSAFGLGVDKNEVRTVIHATLPESLDRFYQEVGRSGRDGIASASLLLYTDQDVEQARDMAGPTFIGNDLGYERWVAMMDDPSRPVTSDGEVWVDLNRLRAGLSIQGKSNRIWNLRTLNLMAMAGLIEITALSARVPGSVSSEDDQEYAESQVAYSCVRICHPNHRDRRVFEDRMNSARNGMLQASAEALNLMIRVAQSEIEISQALVKLYGLALLDHWGPVTPFCGGCGMHWGNYRMSPRELRPFVGRIARFSERLAHSPILKILPREQENLAFIASFDLARAFTDRRSSLMMLLQKAQPHTIWIPQSMSDAQADSLITQMSTFKSDCFVDRFDPRNPTDLRGSKGEVRFVLWLESIISVEAAAALLNSPCALTVLFINNQLPDPNRPDRPWRSVVAHTDEETILRKLIS